MLHSGLDRMPSRALDAQRVHGLAHAAATSAQSAAAVAATSGRWVKLTAESAARVQKYGLTPSTTPGVSHAMIGKAGASRHWLQIVETPSSLITSPFALTALATMMQQRALQAQMDEIIAYLQEVSEKVDDILRAQKDAVLADMIGVDLVIEEALTLQDEVGHVSDVTWSKVQSTSGIIARTQAYAIRQIDALTTRLAGKAEAGDVAAAVKQTEPQVREWLAVLAHSFRLQEGVSVLELGRVMASSPQDLDSHRRGLHLARQTRVELIAGTTAHLLSQMEGVVQRANSRVLLNPFDSPAAATASNEVIGDVLLFRERLGIDSDHSVGDVKKWGQAAAEVRDALIASVAEGANATRRFGASSWGRAAKAVKPPSAGSHENDGPALSSAMAETNPDGVPGKVARGAREVRAAFARTRNRPPSEGEPSTRDEG